MNFRRLKSRLNSNIFNYIWVLTLFACEILSIEYYLFSCKYPFDGAIGGIVIADPQLTDAYSYKQSGILLWLTEFYSDIYMLRNFKRIYKSMRPDLILFVGDLMDGGREWDDAQFDQELRRFKKIFHVNEKVLTLGVAGNHDIGFGTTIVTTAHARFLNTFGSVNALTMVANHTIIALDTIGLSGLPESDAFKTATSFLQSLKDVNLGPIEKRILISHVPIWRPENSACGLKRHFKPMTNRRGYQYQNFIQYDIAAMFIGIIEPTLIISGDDHDDCVYTHYFNKRPIIEHTIVTFSWLQGNLYPGFGVISFKDATTTEVDDTLPSFKLEICDLPPQMDIYTGYILLLGLSVLWTIYQSRNRWVYQGYRAVPSEPANRSLNSFGKYAAGQLLQMAVTVFSFYSILIFYIYFVI